MSDPILLYGATGYSGRLVARELCRLGVRPLLGGRDAQRTAAAAAALGLEHRVASVDDSAALAAAFGEVAVVINAAGPFAHTAEPVALACLESGAHYLDLCGEVPALDRLSRRHAAARTRGVMLLPGVGFDVVPTDCLAAHVARRLGGARSLTLAVSRLGFLSPGSAKTLLEHFDCGVSRHGGSLRPLPLASLERSFDFGAGPRPCLNVSLADVVTAFFTTGIRDIMTFAEATPLLRLLPFGDAFAPWLRSSAGAALGHALADALWRDPPAPADARRMSMAIVAEAEDASGRRVRARLTTPEAYELTAFTAATIAARVAAGDHEPGFQTPARLFGADFILSVPGVARVDLDA
jgi:short subunit dehydrogenase-like uncharacterized protein